MENVIKEKTVEVKVEVKDGKVHLENNRGDSWDMPKYFSERVALASLVYGSLLHNLEDVSLYSGHYRVQMKVETLTD